jgi:SAM-dependent methyltransferase
MLNLQLDNAGHLRRVLQATSDLARRPLNGLRALDLACAHGTYAIELAKRGATVVGIEGRSAWLEKARAGQAAAEVKNLEFVQDDVRNLSRRTYGEFDIVLCLGILYHLDAPDVFDFLDRVSEVCREFVIVETHIATASNTTREWHGHRYAGISTREHDESSSREERLKQLAASLDNPRSFWMTQPSLWNALRHVGFTSVFDCKVPIAQLYVGAERQFKLWGNRTTLAAIKGKPIVYTNAPEPPEGDRDWPESLDEHLFEHVLAQKPTTS